MSVLAEHWPNLLSALGLFAAGFAVIGPNIASIMATSMAQGRQDGLRMAAGVALGSVLWAAMTVAGLASLLTLYAGAMVALKAFGVAFLLWLALKAFRSAGSAKGLPEAPPARRGPFLAGLAIQMTNPKAALAWIATAAIAMSGEAPWQIGAALVASAAVISFIGHAAYAMLFSTQAVVAGYARARRGIEAGLGTLFTYFAFRLATERT
ncbi:MAG: LysE family translocator [Pseudomonadota bacterium]